ncbi:hypothetical protein Hanom_Chr16g01445801 [Helianthus anomalus]
MYVTILMRYQGLNKRKQVSRRFPFASQGVSLEANRGGIKNKYKITYLIKIIILTKFIIKIIKNTHKKDINCLKLTQKVKKHQKQISETPEAHIQ